MKKGIGLPNESNLVVSGNACFLIRTFQDFFKDGIIGIFCLFRNRRAQWPLCRYDYMRKIGWIKRMVLIIKDILLRINHVIFVK